MQKKYFYPRSAETTSIFDNQPKSDEKFWQIKKIYTKKEEFSTQKKYKINDKICTKYPNAMHSVDINAED